MKMRTNINFAGNETNEIVYENNYKNPIINIANSVCNWSYPYNAALKKVLKW